MDELSNYIINIVLSNAVDTKSAICKKYLKDKKHARRKKKLLLKLIASNVKIPVPKISNYLDTIHEFTNEIFYSHFRMSQNSFQKLQNELESHYTNCKTGRPPTNLEESLYLTLWALGNQNSFRELGDRFNKYKGTAYEIFIRTCKLIYKLKNKYIKWPTSNSEFDAILSGFNNLRRGNSFPNVIGCIDGMHLAIQAPSNDSGSYYNRKGFHSIVLQGVCDSEGVFINVFFGWPGRSHDAYIFKKSVIGHGLEHGDIKIPSDLHLLGDSAYPLSTYLIVPYKDYGNLSENEKVFNYRHSSTRIIIEQAFGVLKSKFRILNFLKFRKISDIKYVVLACIILHNFIITKGETSIEISTINNMNLPEDVTSTGSNDSTIDSRMKRDCLCNLLFA